MLAFRCAVRVHTKGHFNSKSQLPHAVSAAPLGGRSLRRSMPYFCHFVLHPRLFLKQRVGTGRQLTRTMVSNGSNAFIDPNLHVKATGQGALTGLTFAAKDLFDVCESSWCTQLARWFWLHALSSNFLTITKVVTTVMTCRLRARSLDMASQPGMPRINQQLKHHQLFRYHITSKTTHKAQIVHVLLTSISCAVYARFICV